MMLNAVLAAWGVFAVLWAAFYLYDFVNNSRKIIEKKANFFGGLYVTGGLASLAFFIQEHNLQISDTLELFQYAGVTILYLGLVFTTYARIRLDGSWSVAACLKEGFEIETRFPYNFIRHPIYSGQLIMCLGTSIYSLNFLVFFFLFGCTYVHHHYRAKREEEFLNLHTNGNYEKVFAHTGRFFPFFFQNNSVKAPR